mgnify:CR=1 FL=1
MLMMKKIMHSVQGRSGAANYAATQIKDRKKAWLFYFIFLNVVKKRNVRIGQKFFYARETLWQCKDGKLNRFEFLRPTKEVQADE